jgi:thiol reductant ABC exporter CydC subunit
MTVQAEVDGPNAPLTRAMGLARPVTSRLVLATLLGAGAIAADIGLIGTAAWLISKASEHPNESAIALAIVAVQFFGLSRGFLRYGERLIGHDAAFRLLADLRVNVYRHLERLTPGGVPGFRRGDLLTRIVRDVDSLQDLVIRAVPAFGSALLVGSLTVVLMWWMLPAAGLILAIALLLAAVGVPWLTGVLARRRESRFAAARGELAAAVVDLSEGAAELIAFGAMEPQLEKIRRRDAELTRIASRSAGTAGIGLALTTLSAGLACWGCLVVGIPAVVSGRLAGTNLAVITLIPLAAIELVVGLPVATQALQRVRQSAARVFEITDAATPVTDPHPAAVVPGRPFDLTVGSLQARYQGAAVSALWDVDFHLPAGRRVAVVGPSGAGKSTLAWVLVRFLEYQRGSVDLDGVEIDRLTGDDLRGAVGLVDQDACLFDTTIAENLRVGARGATDVELLAAIDRVGLTDWLHELPEGLTTEAGVHGSRLSGGQRQRLALARALLADFPVLVLDEPAEHLDVAAADALTADILQAGRDRSLLFITHRLAGLESVDEILVLDGGMVTEHGTHEELLDAGGRYADLWRSEMRSKLQQKGFVR